MTPLTGEDKRLAADALTKRKAGKKPNVQEARALIRYERSVEEENRWHHYHTIPQKHWREMSGRPAKVINEQAERYGIPFGGRIVDLEAVVKALHDFLARNQRRLAVPEDGDPLLANGNSAALERYRSSAAELKALDLASRKNELIPREHARNGLARIASILRNAGDSLQRTCGDEALKILNEALDDAQREIETVFGCGAHDSPCGIRSDTA
jgi:hypothetical protein